MAPVAVRLLVLALLVAVAGCVGVWIELPEHACEARLEAHGFEFEFGCEVEQPAGDAGDNARK